MTREEAIKQIAESYNEAKADYEENEDSYSDKSFIDGVYQGVTSACFYINQIDEPKWQTTEPTDDGLYAVKYYPYNNVSNKPCYCVFELKNGEWIDFIEGSFTDNKTYAYAWLKIEEYKG